MEVFNLSKAYEAEHKGEFGASAIKGDTISKDFVQLFVSAYFHKRNAIAYDSGAYDQWLSANEKTNETHMGLSQFIQYVRVIMGYSDELKSKPKSAKTENIVDWGARKHGSVFTAESRAQIGQFGKR